LKQKLETHYDKRLVNYGAAVRLPMGQDCEVQVKRSEDTVELITKRSNGSIQSVEIDLKNRKVNIRDAEPGENKRNAT